MTDRKPAIVLIDDLRSFVDGRAAEVARTSAAGVELLDRHRNHRLDELWLDHDLGGDDKIWPVVEVLERAAFEGRPFNVGAVIIHSANPAGAVPGHASSSRVVTAEAGRVRAAAAMLARRWATEDVPGISSTFGERCSSQARATACGVVHDALLREGRTW